MIRKIISIFSESAKTFEGQEKDEKVVLLLRRHPFVALLPIGTLCLFVLGVIATTIYFYPTLSSSPYKSLVLFALSMFLIIMWLYAFYFLTMYTLNTVILTNKRIIDRDQHGFFDRKISELHIYRIQDVTISTKGLLPTIIHYGDVIVQTAGIEQHFVFHEMPRPEVVKSEIMKVVSMTNAGVKPHVDN